MADRAPKLLILGTRGIPAAHGGFETFAERLALFLAGRGWQVGVYCQRDVETVQERISTRLWNGVELITVETGLSGPAATLAFDAICTHDAATRGSVCLVLGYNGAVFLPYLRARGGRIVTNMDGIEWRRPKWSLPVRAFFYVSEWIAAWSSQRLVADHPGIADHLARRRPRAAITTIPYGGDPPAETGPPPLGLEPDRYLVSIARIEPDNNILTLVEAFSRRARGMRLVVLGTLNVGNPYHRAVEDAASPEVLFPGAIYEPEQVQALRVHARAYLHGHTVGGTNPSLVEALWAGNAVIAHDNPFNRGTAGDDQFYFSDRDSCAAAIAHVLADEAAVAAARKAARRRAERFRWDDVLASYEDTLRRVGGYPPAPDVSAAEPGAVLVGAAAGPEW
ncbi:glycosyl transferase [Streptomyces purpurogeneiscleroticus]|nr:glycosyl transferase [Streptomyces purpurogeneiscleroticus]